MWLHASRLKDASTVAAVPLGRRDAGVPSSLSEVLKR